MKEHFKININSLGYILEDLLDKDRLALIEKIIYTANDPQEFQDVVVKYVSKLEID